MFPHVLTCAIYCNIHYDTCLWLPWCKYITVYNWLIKLAVNTRVINAINRILVRYKLSHILINGLWYYCGPSGHMLFFFVFFFVFMHTLDRGAKKIKQLISHSYRKKSIINKQEVPAAGCIIQTTGWTENRNMWAQRGNAVISLTENKLWTVPSLLTALEAKYQTEVELSDNDFSALSLGLLSSRLTKVHVKQTWVKKKREKWWKRLQKSRLSLCSQLVWFGLFWSKSRTRTQDISSGWLPWPFKQKRTGDVRDLFWYKRTWLPISGV